MGSVLPLVMGPTGGSTPAVGQENTANAFSTATLAGARLPVKAVSHHR